MSPRCVLPILLFLSAPAFADGGLRHNPFDRPQVLASGGNGGAPALDLRATLTGRGGSLANVGGRLLAPGESVDGYVLEAVGEGVARFARDGRTFTLHVAAEADDDEQDERESEDE